MAPNPDSPRLAAVIRNGEELLRLAEEAGANGIALCGSVVRGEDQDDREPVSDIDFFVPDFRDPDLWEGRMRAEHLVKEFRRVLQPFRVDILRIPGWFLGPAHEEAARRDAVDLRDLIAEFG